jgi:hypothetical protein
MQEALRLLEEGPRKPVVLGVAVPFSPIRKVTGASSDNGSARALTAGSVKGNSRWEAIQPASSRTSRNSGAAFIARNGSAGAASGPKNPAGQGEAGCRTHHSASYRERRGDLSM